MNGLIDIRQVVTQILGFLILLWVMRKFAWTPLLAQLQARRDKIAGEFAEAERRQAQADEARGRAEQMVRENESQKRAKIQEGVAEGQRVAAEIRAHAQQQALDRLARAEDEVTRELEKSKELLKLQMVKISVRGAEKILREKLDESHQRKLMSEFIDEVGGAVRNTTVAARYARALHIVTEQRGETPRALEDLKGMWEVVRPGSRVGLLLETPQVLLSNKRKAIRDLLWDRVARSVVLLVDLLLRKKRLGELEQIVHEFEAIVEKQQGIQRALVVSAVPLTRDESTRLHAELERTTKSKIKLSSEVDPDLEGGALVRIGDHVIDRSVRTLLEQIERQLSHVSV